MAHPPERGARSAVWTDREGSDHDRTLRPRLDGALGRETQEDARGKRFLTPFVCHCHWRIDLTAVIDQHICAAAFANSLSNMLHRLSSHLRKLLHDLGIRLGPLLLGLHRTFVHCTSRQTSPALSSEKPTFDSAIVRLLVESPCTHLRSSLYPPLISLDFVPTILLL